MLPLEMALAELYQLVGMPVIPARVAVVNSTGSAVRPDSREEVLISGDNASEVLEDGAVLRDFSDRRQYSPTATSAGARTFRGGDSGLRVKESAVGRVPFRVSFSDPTVVIECARRMARRQSMFARGHFGLLGIRRRKVGRFSGISCSR